MSLGQQRHKTDTFVDSILFFPECLFVRSLTLTCHVVPLLLEVIQVKPDESDIFLHNGLFK